ncbi:hypothetical protein D3C87_1597150 [compost metagenome]
MGHEERESLSGGCSVQQKTVLRRFSIHEMAFLMRIVRIRSLYISFLPTMGRKQHSQDGCSFGKLELPLCSFVVEDYVFCEFAADVQ